MRPTSARRRLIALLASVPAVLAAPAVASDSQDTPLSPAITAIMAEPQYAIAAWGNPRRGRRGKVFNARGADEMFIPGSNAKLFSVSAVWNLLGPDHRSPRRCTRSAGARAGSSRETSSSWARRPELGGRTSADGAIDYTNFDHADANAIPGATLTSEDPWPASRAWPDRCGTRASARDRQRRHRRPPVRGHVGSPADAGHRQRQPDRPGHHAGDRAGPAGAVTFRPPSAAYVVDATVVTGEVGDSRRSASPGAPGRSG